MTGAGVPVGASIAYQTLASKPGSPASEAVGTSGKPAAPAASGSPAPLRSCRGQQERRRYQGAVQHAPDRTKEEGNHRNISLRHGSSVVGRQGRKSFRSMSPKLGGIPVEVRAFLGSVTAGLVASINHLVPTRWDASELGQHGRTRRGSRAVLVCSAYLRGALHRSVSASDGGACPLVTAAPRKIHSDYECEQAIE